MVCPDCGGHLDIPYSTHRKRKNDVKRFRLCNKCGHRFITVETIAGRLPDKEVVVEVSIPVVQEPEKQSLTSEERIDRVNRLKAVYRAMHGKEK
jgi:transcriptional regulator NrdR family protein